MDGGAFVVTIGRMLTVFVIVCLSLGATACTNFDSVSEVPISMTESALADTPAISSSLEEETETQSLSQVQSDYDSALEALNQFFPDAAEAMKPMPTFEEDAVFEDGFGASIVAFDLQCAWLNEYASSEDASAKRSALLVLHHWVDLDVVVDSIDANSRSDWRRDTGEVMSGAREDAFLVDMAHQCSS